MPEVAARTTALSFPAVDNPDWDHARTRRLSLRSVAAEWSQSTVTQREADGLYYHRTDFAYEGLLCLVGGENWKFVDKVGIGVIVDKKPYPLIPSHVEATPDCAIYHFDTEHGPFAARYRLLEITEPDGSVDSVWMGEYGFESGAPPGEILIDLKPLFDIRHMYYFSDPDGHQLGTVSAQVITIGNTHWLGLGTDAECALVAERHGWDLFYPLGAGNREIVDGRVCFQRQYFRGTALGRIRQRGPQCRLFMAASASEEGAIRKVQHASVMAGKLIADTETRFAEHLQKLGDVRPEIALRSYVMSEKFAMATGGLRVPESGGWWFRTPWFRNTFSGFMHSWRTLDRLGRHDVLEGALRLAMRYRDPHSGNLPNRVPELKAHQDKWLQTGKLPAEYYQGWDALITMFAWLAEARPDLEADLRADLRATFVQAYRTFKNASLETAGGPPVLADNGLLLTLPSHSWLAGRRHVWAEGIQVGDLPMRVDRAWQVEDILRFRDGHYAWERYQLPTYYLPEVNAQWIRMLGYGRDLLADAPPGAGELDPVALARELEEVDQRARQTFKPLFWNTGVGYLYNLVTQDGRVDPMVTACGIEAAALGIDQGLFSAADLESIWHAVRQHLLVTRHLGGRPAAFGILVKDSDQRIFLGDQQYHEAVCWPRHTPYLIRVLSAIGESEIASELLETNLAHMFDEGAVFYANEMLSLPEGVNPTPHPATCHDPVPVKNPMQWGSLWCDPYLFAD